MARKYEPFQGGFAWACERCEETVIIAGYDEVERFISPNTKWKHEFENAFFERGLGLLADYLDEINIIRKAKELPLIELKKTNVYDYARDPDRATKIEARTNIRRELREASKESHAKLLDIARAEMQALEPPHRTYEEFKEFRAAINAENALSHQELQKRQAALIGKQSMNQLNLDPETAAIMLGLASDPELITDIIARLSPSDALTTAKAVEDADLRNRLVRRALNSELQLVRGAVA